MLTLRLRRRLSLTALFAALLPSITASAAEPPPAPSELYIWRLSYDPYGLSLIWRDNSKNEQGFEIFNGVETRQVGANTNDSYYNYRWGGMKPGQYVCFKIRAYNSAGSSAWEPNVDPWYRCGTTPKNPPPDPVDQVVNTDLYAGYGVKGKEFTSVRGIWWVPRVECPPFWNIRPWTRSRAAPWVGLAGKELFNHDVTWLIQVGTVSYCRAGFVHYKAVSDVIVPRVGGGRAQVPPVPFDNFDVGPNDMIEAMVSYDSKQKRFDIMIRNHSRDKTGQRSEHIPEATAENSRSYALCIVESDKESPLDGGLARFGTPIEWWVCGPQSPSNGPEQVDKFDIGTKAWVSPTSHHPYPFTVEWRQW